MPTGTGAVRFADDDDPLSPREKVVSWGARRWISASVSASQPRICSISHEVSRNPISRCLRRSARRAAFWPSAWAAHQSSSAGRRSRAMSACWDCRAFSWGRYQPVEAIELARRLAKTSAGVR